MEQRELEIDNMKRYITLSKEAEILYQLELMDDLRMMLGETTEARKYHMPEKIAKRNHKIRELQKE